MLNDSSCLFDDGKIPTAPHVLPPIPCSYINAYLWLLVYHSEPVPTPGTTACTFLKRGLFRMPLHLKKKKVQEFTDTSYAEMRSYHRVLLLLKKLKIWSSLWISRGPLVSIQDTVGDGDTRTLRSVSPMLVVEEETLWTGKRMSELRWWKNKNKLIRHVLSDFLAWKRTSLSHMNWWGHFATLPYCAIASTIWFHTALECEMALC